MAKAIRKDFFEFDPNEIAVLLKVVGAHSPSTIEEMGLDVDAFERVWSTLTNAAYAPLRESAP